MTIEIMLFPIENGDFLQLQYVINYQRVTYKSSNLWLVQHSFSMFDFFGLLRASILSPLIETPQRNLGRCMG